MINYFRGKKKLEKSLEKAKEDMISLSEKLHDLQTGNIMFYIRPFHSFLSRR